MSDAYAQLAAAIIAEQEHIIGPLAIEQAQHTSGLTVDWSTHSVSFTGEKSKAVEDLVEGYQHLFGQTSVEICKDAAAPFLSDLKGQSIPALLQ